MARAVGSVALADWVALVGRVVKVAMAGSSHSAGWAVKCHESLRYAAR